MGSAVGRTLRRLQSLPLVLLDMCGWTCGYAGIPLLVDLELTNREIMASWTGTTKIVKYFKFRSHLKDIPHFTGLCFIEVCFTELHGCFVFLQMEGKTLYQQQDCDSLYSDIHFIRVVWNIIDLVRWALSEVTEIKSMRETLCEGDSLLWALHMRGARWWAWPLVAEKNPSWSE